MENSKNTHNEVAENVIFIIRFNTREEVVGWAERLYSQNGRMDEIAYPLTDDVWNVGRRPMVDGKMIELSSYKNNQPGALPENADLTAGVVIESGVTHYVENVIGGYLVCVSGNVRYATVKAPSPTSV